MMRNYKEKFVRFTRNEHEKNCNTPSNTKERKKLKYHQNVDKYDGKKKSKD